MIALREQDGLGERELRAALFCAILFIAWITFKPFSDLASPDTLELADGRDVQLYVAFGLMAAAAAVFVWRSDRAGLAALATPVNLAFAGWILATCVTSADPSTSVKRVVMQICASICCLALFLLPRDRAELARLAGFVALVIVGLSYFGVLFMPDLSIHQATDIGEPQLAGDWRGIFGHKNISSAMFSILSFIGLFVLRAGRKAEGWLIFGLSLVFVFASGGKSSTAICLTTIVLSFAAARIRNAALWWIIVITPLALLTVFGLGGVVFPQLKALTAALPVDASFTGRIDIWTMAVPKALEKPIFGHGLGAFWNTAELRFGGDDTNVWAGNAAHAHNGYLDAVLALGLPGLLLLFAAMIVQPARDLRRVLARGDEPALALMFLQIWMFSLYLNALETIYLDRANPSWIAFLFAVFGIRYLAQFKIRR
ncbi:O-antigen ligase family protein [Methylosinus trichosporium]|uniref:O-antigen polymerase n=1 Tax=Methylosinus trichosporium (strain ATCC 35070 / NCIMB 11131 / UNIQEM 75 / OB3b) TaxID=595536 RepID=A0A2D2D033_METT3|nr:O-antigen ligase [Methylosinus trichosporium]ATQ68358.1 O-antigen polymerase [Methylosinus trichosporium OB3b]